MKVLAQFTTCTEETDSFLIKTRVQVWISSVYGNNEPVYFNNNIPFPRTINYEIIHYPTQSCLYRYKAAVEQPLLAPALLHLFYVALKQTLPGILKIDLLAPIT